MNFENWIRKLVAKDWVVYAKKPFDRPERAVAYIGRYTHRIAIANSRILSIDNGIIRFSFKNYKKIKSVKKYKEIREETELPAMEFIRRFIRHIPPKRCHRIRHFGFLGNGCKKQFHELRERLFRESNTILPENTGKPEKSEHASYVKKEACKPF